MDRCRFVSNPVLPNQPWASQKPLWVLDKVHTGFWANVAPGLLLTWGQTDEEIGRRLLPSVLLVQTRWCNQLDESSILQSRPLRAIARLLTIEQLVRTLKNQRPLFACPLERRSESLVSICCTIRQSFQFECPRALQNTFVSRTHHCLPSMLSY
jgi:hypothetical protein